MGAIWTSRTRSRQPQQNTRLSAAYPRPGWVTLPTGGMFASGYPGGVRNLVKPTEVATSTDSNNTFTQGATPFGIAAVNASIGVGGLNAQATKWEVTTNALCGATEITLLSSFWRRGATDESVQWLNFRTDFIHSMDVFASTATTLTFGADWAGAWNGVSQQTVTIGDGLVTIIAVIRQDGARFFCNGVMTGTKAGSGFTVGSTPYAVMINSGARSPILFQEAWKAALSDAQALQLSRNPWDAFAPQRTARIYSFPTAGGGATVAVPAGALTLTGYAPTVAATAHQTIAVPKGALVLSAFAPTVSTSAAQTIAVPLASLTLTGYAPTVAATAHQTISVPAGSLTLTGYAPTVYTTAVTTIAVPAGTLTLTGYAPTVSYTTHAYIGVPAGALTLTGYAPTVIGGTSSIWTPASASSGTWTPASASGGTWTPQ